MQQQQALPGLVTGQHRRRSHFSRSSLRRRSDHPHHNRSDPMDARLRESAAEQAAFSLRLASRVARKHAAASNLAFSPLSLHVVLSLLAAGSAGETLGQLVSFLLPSARGHRRPLAGSPTDTELLNSLASQVIELVLADGSPLRGPQVSYAGGLWVERSLPLKPTFEQLAASAYKAEAKAVDFLTKAAEVASEVNSWAESATGGLIEQLLPPGSVNDKTRLILANALYFKGAWRERFEPSLTRRGEFHLLDGGSVGVPFMTSWRRQFVRSHDGFKVLKLPYRQGDDRRRHFSMYFFLPDRKDGLWDLMERLQASESAPSGGGGNHLDRYLPVREVDVRDFKVPGFKISFGFEASEIMKESGVVEAFRGAELTEMVREDCPVGKQRRLAVSGVFHKCFVEVNEAGTEAAAATAVVMMQCAMGPPPVDFVADHPFLFLVREDETGAILFVGHVLNPSMRA